MMPDDSGDKPLQPSPANPTQRRLSPAKGEPVGRPANRGKGLIILFYRKIIIRTLPDVTCFAARVTAITYADRQIQRQSKGFAKHIRRLHLRNFW